MSAHAGPALATGALLLMVLAGACGSVRSQPAPQRASLRVCADPNNLPFSNEKEQGFENAIASLLARDLHTDVYYVWRPQRRGFVRNTLNQHLCDVVLGVPVGYDPVRTTRPYYRSTYVFVTRHDRGLHITSLDDTILPHLRIGIHLVGDDYENPPPAQALAARGIIDNVKGYSIYGDYSTPNPPARLVEAVATGDVDVAIVWGPLAGYFAKHSPVRLDVAPVTPAQDASGQMFAFSIAMGVRHRDATLAATLDTLIARDARPIHDILERYGVPLVDSAVGAAADRRTNGEHYATHQ